VTTFTLIAATLGPYVYFFASACDKSKYHGPEDLDAYMFQINDVCYNITTVVFGVLFLLFLAVSMHMICTLKQIVPTLYSEYRVWLWLGSFSLSLPLFLRFFLDLLWTSDLDWHHWLVNDDHTERNTAYQLLYFIFTTYVPIVSQLASLMFGYIRKQQQEDN
jgi:hypothetical protein